MAKPPEPLAEVLPVASLVVEGSVKEVVSVGPAPPPAQPDVTEKISDRGTLNSEQILILDVKRVLKGTHAGGTLRVKKPVAGYAVKVGTQGAWLLDTSADVPVVLGRYGPDSWSLAKVEAALKG